MFTLLPEIDPSDAAQSCDHKTRNNDMVWIFTHKFSPSKKSRKFRLYIVTTVYYLLNDVSNECMINWPGMFK